MFCEKCGTPLDANAKFCNACGSLVNSVDNGQTNQNFYNTAQQTQNFANNGFNPNAGYDPNSGFNGNYNNNNFNNSGFNNFQQPEAKPKKSKTPMVVGVIVVLIAALVGAYFAFGKDLFSKVASKKDPVQKTFTAFSNIASSEAVDFETSLKLKLEGEGASNAMMKNLVEGFAVKVKGKYVKATGAGEYGLTVDYSGTALIDVKMYADKDTVVISSDELLEQPLYANIKDLQNLMGGEMPTTTFDVKKYEAIAKELEKNTNYKALSDDYKAFFETLLKEFIVAGAKADVKVNENGKDRTIKTDELTMNIDTKFIKKFVTSFMDKIANDKNLKPFLIDAMKKFAEVAKETGDFEQFGMTEEEFNAAMDEMNAGWEDAMAELKASMTDAEAELDEVNFDSKATFRIDSDNKLRQFIYEIKGGEMMGEAAGMPGLNGSIVIDTVFNAYDGDVKVTKPSTEGALNLSEMDEYELMSLMGDLEQKLQDKIMSQFGGMQ